MKHLLLIIAAICINIGALAQASPEIKKLFSDYASQDGKTTETIISGDALKGTDLSLYRSLVITGSPDEAESIAERISKCGAKAVSREVKYIDGKIYYAQFSLPPIGHNGYNRYLFYLNSHLKGGNRIMIVFMSGKAQLEQIKKLISQQ